MSDVRYRMSESWGRPGGVNMIALIACPRGHHAAVGCDGPSFSAQWSSGSSFGSYPKGRRFESGLRNHSRVSSRWVFWRFSPKMQVVPAAQEFPPRLASSPAAALQRPRRFRRHAIYNGFRDIQREGRSGTARKAPSTRGGRHRRQPPPMIRRGSARRPGTFVRVSLPAGQFRGRASYLAGGGSPSPAAFLGGGRQ